MNSAMNTAAVNLVVHPDGSLQCVYDETIDLAAIGQLAIRRGSHVEPDEGGQWFADLSPVAGPRLGPFALRSDALAAERVWLETWLSVRPGPVCGAL
jgi:hypothetical protein